MNLQVVTFDSGRTADTLDNHFRGRTARAAVAEGHGDTLRPFGQPHRVGVGGHLEAPVIDGLDDAITAFGTNYDFFCTIIGGHIVLNHKTILTHEAVWCQLFANGDGVAVLVNGHELEEVFVGTNVEGLALEELGSEIGN